MGGVAALVLAAGRGSRFGTGPGTSKVFAELDGRALVAHAVDTALGSRAAPVIVVTGQGAALAAAALAGRELVDRAVDIVHNPDFASGMAGSLKVGLDALPATVDGVIVLLGDMPLVRSITLDRLIDGFVRERPDAVIPCADGRRGNPVLLGRSLFPQLQKLSGDEGARAILSDVATKVLECPVDDGGIFADVDTPESLAMLTSRGSP